MHLSGDIFPQLLIFFSPFAVCDSWHYVCRGRDSTGTTVISFPCDTCSSPHFFGGHTSLWRCETFHTADFPVTAANFRHEGIASILCHNLSSPGLLPFLGRYSRPALHHTAWQFCQHVCFAHNSKVSNSLDTNALQCKLTNENDVRCNVSVLHATQTSALRHASVRD
jgi:hypothetical protein